MNGDLLEEIFSAVKAKMENQGAYDRTAYEEFVEEAILDFRREGLITDDDESEAIKDKLMLRWQEAQNFFVKE
jgi:hypothetical protein